MENQENSIIDNGSPENGIDRTRFLTSESSPAQTQGAKEGDSQAGNASPSADNGQQQNKGPSSQGTDKKPAKSGRDKDFARLTYKFREEERKRVDLEKRLRAFEEQSKAKPQTAEKLDRKNFASEEEYLDHVFNERIQKYEDNRKASEEERARGMGEASRIQQSWDGNVVKCFPSEEEQEEYATAIMEFGDPSERLPAEALHYIASSHVGPKILKYFADKPGFAESFSSFHRVDQDDALRKIAAYVSRKKEIQQEAAQAKPAKALGRLNPGGLQSNPTELPLQARLDKLRTQRR